MTTLTLREIAPDDLEQTIAEACLPVVRDALIRAGEHHRLRVVDLPEGVMWRICEGLQGDSRWVARLLGTAGADTTYVATATKIIELRNNEVRPVVVFLPTGLRTAAEDSLDIATFQQVEFGEIWDRTRSRILDSLGAKLPPRQAPELMRSLRSFFDLLTERKLVRDMETVLRFLITWRENGGSLEAAGGSLFVLGLIPDQSLFTRGPQLVTWLSRNIEVVKELTDPSRPLQERISRLTTRQKLKPDTVQKRLFTYLRSHLAPGTRSWSADVATDPQWHDLSFEQWPFQDAGETEQVRLVLDALPLPRQVGDKVTNAVNLQVWDINKQKDLRVAFKAIPGPRESPSWKTYRFQLFENGEEGATLLWESPNYPKPKQSARSTRTLKADDLRGHVPEGVYFLRAEAFGEDGAVITHAMPADPKNPKGRQENESDLFHVAEGEVIVDGPDEPRAIFVDSLLSAWFDLRASPLTWPSRKGSEIPDRESLTGSWNVSSSASLKEEVRFQIDTEGAQGRTIRLPGLLQVVEQTILANPGHLAGYRLNLRDARSVSDLPPVEPVESGLSGDEFPDFIGARRALFLEILNQHRTRNLDDDALKLGGLVEITDLLALSECIVGYTRSWLNAVEEVLVSPETPQRGALLSLLAGLDGVHVRWRATSADPGKGLLLPPTHPLRLLWHLQHARVRDEALTSLATGTAEVKDVGAFIATLSNELIPANLPLVVFDQKGRAFIEQDLLTPFWSLYLPADGDKKQHDVNHAREQARRLMGIRKKTTRLGEIPAAVLSSRLVEYLRRHPYVEQIRINVFNPGEAVRVADLLRAVERLRREMALARQEPPELRYAVHLFSAREYIERAGEALDALLDPDRQVEEEDEFTIGASSHLRPKLLISRSTHEEFARKPDAYPAHISVLLEQFRVDGRLGRADSFARGAFVHGLVLESETRLEASSGLYGWVRGVHPTAPMSGDSVKTLLVEAEAAEHRVQAAAAGGRSDGKDLPVIALHLDPFEQALLRSIHEVSDQVFTLDRNLGLDYFDSRSTPDDVGYLLDFSPEFLQGDGERLLVTTRSTDELVALVQPALQSVGLEIPAGREQVVIEALRSVSGRLALRLFSGPTAMREIVGLLLTRLLLEDTGLLEDRVLVPVDSHRSWFEGEGSHQRADLLLVHVEPLTRTIDITVIEVKARMTLLESDRGQLYGEMRAQADNTRTRLIARFDLEMGRCRRADFDLRAKELFSLLTFYLGRARRYGLVSAEREAEARDFLSTIDQGYHLRVRTRGVVFAGDTLYHHLDEDEPGFPVHRFGAPTARALMTRAVAEPVRTVVDCPSIPDGAVAEVLSFFEAKKDTRRPLVQANSGESTVEAKTPTVTIPLPTPTLGQTRYPPRQPEMPRMAAEPVTAAEPPPSEGPQAPPESQPSGESEVATSESSPLHVDILLGASEMTAQFGMFGRFNNARIGIDLTGCNTVSLFGVQGFGKSYTLGVIAEMGAQPMSGINQLDTPLATVLFHYHKSDAYEPEYATAIEPNNKVREVERLLAEYQAHPAGLRDLILLVPVAKLEQRRKEYPGIEVHPIKFASSELGADSWKFLLAAYGNDSLYVRQIVAIMRRYRDRLTFDDLKREIGEAELSPSTRRLAEDRLSLAEPYIDDRAHLRSLLRPGRTIIVDLRDEWLEKEDALGLFVVMMKTFSQARHEGREFNKLMVFDEAHKYITESELIGQVVEIIREMRHQATSVIIASQDPLSVPRAVIELTSILVLHRMTSPQWLKHLKNAISALEMLNDQQVASLMAGEALVWAQRATDRRFTERPQKIHIRPRVTKHGGGTKTAVAGATVR